jgi:hypothetical protein
MPEPDPRFFYGDPPCLTCKGFRKVTLDGVSIISCPDCADALATGKPKDRNAPPVLK